MAKKAETIEVILRNDWYDGGSLRRVADNPHEFPASALETLPASAKIKVDDDFVPVADFPATENKKQLALKV